MREETIRPITAADLPSLLCLYEQLNPDNADRADPSRYEAALLAILNDPKIHCFVTEIDMQIVASCVLILVPNLTRSARPFGLIENVVTHIDYRRQGIGKRLLQRALHTAWEAGCYKVMLLSGSQRAETHQFYLNVGFRSDLKTGFIAYPTVLL